MQDLEARISLVVTLGSARAFLDTRNRYSCSSGSTDIDCYNQYIVDSTLLET